ncbi:adenosylcobinamide-GDP ribazoletransferase, partial [Methanoculleus sp.]|uniref:adenosylcobinamide-GDP ribazoletransferase n=1 Tax=Methanoculleus sp. TaxID=90427 RepID=UPI00320D0FA3
MKSVLALLQFCTSLPLGRPVEFEYFARRSYLYPLAGYVIGGIAAGITYWIAPPPAVGAAVALAIVLVLSGCNHFDGLLDFGDGLMAHGSREKRIAAMTDRTTGAGAVAA